jgi:molybdopterin-guanine dinucleotide biosynthesis protein MobB
MKIIHVVGRSNSGKTTFIKNLVPLLKKIGKVGVIKHLGDHDYGLEEGKDTTLFYEAGADIAMGIDSQKSVVAIRNTSLQSSLDLLSCQGMDYVVIEGFKQEPFPKIVIGSLEIDHCVLDNPGIDDVIPVLHRFADYPPL